jgi:hypothetical protein
VAQTWLELARTGPRLDLSWPALGHL